MTAAQLRLVRSATHPIIAELEAVDDVTALTSEAERVRSLPVLCIGGRGKLDDLLTAIAVQLLNMHGFEASHVSYERFAARRLNEGRLASCPMVCVISFAAGEPLPYLRNLLQRLSDARVSREVILGMAAEGEFAGEHLPVTVSEHAIPVVASFQQLRRACAQDAQMQGQRQRQVPVDSMDPN